jgi:long-chain fatty acid transport protein
MLTIPRQSFLAAACAVVSLAFAPQPAQAAGFAIFEQGTRAMGFAGAYTAQASDPSAIFFNPAGVAFLKGKQIYLGGTLILPKSDFTGADPFPGSRVREKSDAGLLVPPVFDYTQQLSESMVVGIGVHVPFGLKTAWQNRDSTYSGRFISKQAQIKGFSINPTVAFKLADRFAVGGGVDVRLSTLELERNAAAPVNPFTFKTVDVASVRLQSNTNMGIGFNVGVLAKPSDAVSVGVSYHHSVKVDYDGTATFTRLSTGNAQLDAAAAASVPSGTTPVATTIKFPAMASAGIAYTWNDWTVEGDVNWYQWSSFDTLPLTFAEASTLSGAFVENYKDSWQYRFGIERRYNDRWTFRGGYFYDQSPTPAESVGPLIPDSNRHGLCVGASWSRGRFHVDLANWYLIFSERSTQGANRDNYNGTYKNSAELFSVSVGYGF